MISKKKLLKKSRLYVIVDREAAGTNPLPKLAKKISAAGADIIQLRDKTFEKKGLIKKAYLLQRYLKRRKTIFIVNDHLDVALLVNSDGLHLGQKDTPIKIARRFLGKDKIIGISCHNLKQALEAQKEGADYIGLGPVFATQTKPEYKPIGLGVMKKVAQNISIPCFALGDINRGNIGQVLSSGAKRVALCRAVLKSGNIPLAIKQFKTDLR